MKNLTCYDAIKFIKSETFLPKLRSYNIRCRVYYDLNSDKLGIYHVLLDKSKEIYDMYLEINVLKRNYKELDFKENESNFLTENFKEYTITIEKVKDKSNEYIIEPD